MEWEEDVEEIVSGQQGGGGEATREKGWWGGGCVTKANGRRRPPGARLMLVIESKRLCRRTSTRFVYAGPVCVGRRLAGTDQSSLSISPSPS